MLLMKKLAESAEDINQLFKKVESNTNLEDYTFEVGRGSPVARPPHPGPAPSLQPVCPPSLTQASWSRPCWSCGI